MITWLKNLFKPAEPLMTYELTEHNQYGFRTTHTLEIFRNGSSINTINFRTKPSDKAIQIALKSHMYN